MLEAEPLDRNFSMSSLFWLRVMWRLVWCWQVTAMDQQQVLATLSSHLVMIGVFCLLLIACLLFNLCTSVHTLRTHWRHWNKIAGSTHDLAARPKYRRTQAASEVSSTELSH